MLGVMVSPNFSATISVVSSLGRMFEGEIVCSCYRAVAGLTGATIHKIIYGINPGNPPGSSSKIKITRMTVASILKYSARPPHTPAIFLSDVERYNFFI
jgi:hypothetical protein